MTRDFRLLVIGQGLSWLGTGFQTVALAVAVVMGHGGTGGPGALGAVLATSIAAQLVCTLFGGVWADRVQPQRVMVLSDLVRFAAVAAMAILFATRADHLLLLCALAAVAAGAGAFFTPAMTALKPMLVPIGARQQANATLGILQTAAGVAGPVLGGATVAWLGTPFGFAVNAATSLLSVATVLPIRTRAARSPGAGLLSELAEGWTEIRRRDWLLSGILAATGYHVANGVVIVLVQVVAIRELGGAGSLGVLAAAEGLGGLVGAAVALRFRPARILRAGWLGLLLMPFWVLGYVWPGVLAGALLGAVIGYAGLIFFDVAWQTAMADHVPHHVLARVASWDALASFVGMPLGYLLAGPLAGAFGIHPVLVVCAAVFALSAVVPLRFAGTRTLTRPQTDERVLVAA